MRQCDNVFIVALHHYRIVALQFIENLGLIHLRK